MLRLAQLKEDPSLLAAFEGASVLIQATTSAETVVGGKSSRTQSTALFLHETIAMMKADRAERLEKLRTVIGEDSEVLPICKKPDSFWEHVTVGRVPSSDIVVDDPAVSNLHAHFAFQVGSAPVCVQDEGSSNGTFVNREQVQPHTPVPIVSGDCIRFGQSIFYFVGPQMLEALVAPEPKPE